MDVTHAVQVITRRWLGWVLRATGYFGGLGFLGFGGLFGVLSATRHLLPVMPGASARRTPAEMAVDRRITRPDAPVRSRDVELHAAAPRGRCPERRAIPIVTR